MRWTSIPRLYRRRLKVTLVPELFALLGIAVGVALLFASQVAGSTLSGSAARLANDVLGSVRLELVARSPEGLSESKLSQVRALPGVRYATAVVEEPANAIGPRGSHSIELVGVEPSASTLGGSAVRRFNSAQLARIEALAVPESIASAIGAGQLQPITLQIAGLRERALVGLEVLPKQSALIASSPIVVAPLSYAQQLVGIGHRVNRIFVACQPGQEPKVRRELSRLAGQGLDVRPADFDATLFNEAATPIEQSTTLFSAISALVGLAFAVYAMLLTVPHRRATVHDLRMLGYTRGQVVKVLLLDALVLGVLSCLLGLIFGELISVLFLHANPGYLVFAFPVASQRQVSASDIGLAVGAAMLASFGGVFAPIRRIFGPFHQRESAGEEIALRRNGGSAIAGLACLVLTTAVLVWAPQARAARHGKPHARGAADAAAVPRHRRLSVRATAKANRRGDAANRDRQPAVPEQPRALAGDRRDRRDRRLWQRRHRRREPEPSAGPQQLQPRIRLVWRNLGHPPRRV